MNNAKMWLVVKPTVGIPLFLTAVAVGSFSVHVAVLRNTTWVADFLAGRPLGTPVASLTVPKGSTENASLTTPAVPGQAQQVLVVMPDGTTAKAILETPVTLASASGKVPVVIDQ
jgi:light-harvesting protein B-800-850 alpha chain